jgi:hybrid cluster-associated redox disulfide protein
MTANPKKGNHNQQEGKMAKTKVKKTARKTISKATSKVAGKSKAGKPAAKKAAKITGNMTLGEAVSKYPRTMEVLFRYGLHCIGCHISAYETIEQGALAHGLSKEQVKKMIEEMNKQA